MYGELEEADKVLTSPAALSNMTNIQTLLNVHLTFFFKSYIYIYCTYYHLSAIYIHTHILLHTQ